MHRVAPIPSLLFILASLSLIEACSQKAGSPEKHADQGAQTPIPRFPAAGLPSAGQSSTGELTPEVTQPGSAATTGSIVTSGDLSTRSTTSNPSNLTSKAQDTTGTSGPEPGPEPQPEQPEPEPQPQPEPGQARFVDWGVFRIGMTDTGEFVQTAKRRTPANEHQMTRLGHERMPNFMGQDGVVIRRSYGIFDVREVHNAVSAKLEYYVFASSLASAGAGGYSSPDPSETIEIHALDRFTPQQIIDAPFEQNSNHSLDPVIAEDLADGKLYARFEMTPELLAVKELSPTPTATPGRSDCEDTAMRACGRWLTIPLSADAVQDINQSKGLWGMGWNLTSVTHAKSSKNVREFVFFGAHMDTSPSQEALVPDYIKPKPRLVLEYGAKD